MGSKFIDYLIWVVAIFVVLALLWIIVSPIIWWTQWSEIRLCIRLFLIMFAVNTFATLRLYNSIVQNTRFSIKLREVMLKFIGVIPGLERGIKSLNNSLNATKTTSDTLKKGVSDNTDKVVKLTETLNKFSNSKNFKL